MNFSILKYLIISEFCLSIQFLLHDNQYEFKTELIQKAFHIKFPTYLIYNFLKKYKNKEVDIKLSSFQYIFNKIKWFIKIYKRCNMTFFRTRFVYLCYHVWNQILYVALPEWNQVKGNIISLKTKTFSQSKVEKQFTINKDHVVLLKN